MADDFVPALGKLLDRAEPPEHILIETSGLALPKPLVSAFNWPAIRSRVTVDGIIAVIDGPAVAEGTFVENPEALARQRQADGAVDHDNPLEEVFEDQLLCADLVILNKADLLDEPELERVRATIAAQLPRAVKTIATDHGQVDPSVLLGLGAAAEADLAARPSHHETMADHDHDDFESIALPIGTVSSSELARRQGRARRRDRRRPPDQGLRAGRRQADAARRARRRPAGEPSFRPARGGRTRARDGRLVVIGLKGFDRAAVAAALAG